MDHSTHNRIVSFIWSIADDCLRDVFVRGKYRDVILPMFVLRRLDCLLEPSKDKVLAEVHFQKKEAKLKDMDPQGLRDASGYVFYNTSNFTLKSLLGNPSQLDANLKNYLNGFSDNVKEIVEKFDFRNQVRKMIEADCLHDVIEKFVSEEINLSPNETDGPDGRKLPGLSNLGMGYVFEELIRKFNEDNNEEAGEHFTPREVINLMTNIVFGPVKNKLPDPVTIYDPACGSGGMLTESQGFILDPDGEIAADVDVYLYGKECQPETYAICKSDMMIKNDDPANIRFGSTLATDEFSDTRFDFMLSNPPYGKSWKTDQKYIKDGKDVIDPRFQVNLADYAGQINCEDATPRSSDGQLLFLMEMVNKMKTTSDSPLGSRIASVHNGSSLFTGDAGSGESNIRRHIIENDLLEAIIQLPNNLFYNTGITTYIWVLSNHKAPKRRGKVQLIDASQIFQKLRKNLGNKNCEFSPKHIKQIASIYQKMTESDISKIFVNRDFGYYKVAVERPLRLMAQFTTEKIEGLRFIPAVAELSQWLYEKYGDDVYGDALGEHKKAIKAHIEHEQVTVSPKNLKMLLSKKAWSAQLEIMLAAGRLAEAMGNKKSRDFNQFDADFNATAKELNIKLDASQKKQILNAITWRDETAAAVIKKIHTLKGKKLGLLLEKYNTELEHLGDFGYWPGQADGEFIEYQPDSELRDSENVPLDQTIHDYFLAEVRPHVADAWLDIDKTKIGYEISFNKYFYKHTPLRSLEEVTAEILQLEKETEGLLKKLVSFGKGKV